MYTRRRVLTTAAMGVGAVSGALVTGRVSAQDSTPTTESFPVNVRFLNAMTSVDAIDVYINGDDSDQRVIEGLPYGTPSEAFPGTAPATSVLIKQNIEFGVDRYIYSVVVPTEAGKDYLVVVSDLVIIPTEYDLSELGPDESRARVVHASAQAPSLDIYASPTDGGLALGDLVPVVADIHFAQVTDGGNLAAGSYDVQATAAGTTDVAIAPASVAMDAGQVYTHVIIGKPGDTDTPLTFVSVAAAAR